MSTPPGVPNIEIRPRAAAGSLSFWWTAPTPNGGPAVTKYTLACSSISYTQDLGPTVFTYTVTGLTNGVEHVFTLTATNADGTGPAATFRSVQPGVRPFGPSQVTVSTVNTSTALITWNLSTIANEGASKWFVIKSIPSTPTLSTTRVGAYSFDRSMQLPVPSTNIYYQFLVQSLNDTGYCTPFAYTSRLGFGVFLPTSLGSLQLWLDGADPLGTGAAPANGTSITTWADKSGAGNTATAGGTTPTFSATSNAIVFGGAGYYNTNYSASLSNESLFIVYRKNTGSAEQPALVGPSDTSARFITARDTNFRLEGSSYYSAFGSIGPTNSISLDSNYVAELITSGGTQTTYVTGGSQGTSVAVTYTAGRTSKIGVPFLVGAPDASQFLTGAMYEIIGYNTALTPFDRQKVEGYLGWKWGLQSNLPASHPFYSAAPTGTPAFSPRSFSGLQIWYDGVDPLGTGTAPVNGASITTWADKSGTNTNATNSGAGAIYDSSTSSIYFGASTSNYTTSYSASLSSETAFIVQRVSTNTTSESGLRGMATGGRSFNFVPGSNAGGASSRSVAWGSVTALNSVSRNTNTLYSYANTTNSHVVSVDGGRSTGPTTSLSFTGGIVTELTANYTNMYEIIAYNRSLSTEDRQTVEGYLAWKWGLQSQLPSTHPYKSAAP